MDMQININTLLKERNKRAWTQAHLAEVCDLSLRTIQRIEKTGTASHESIKALAAVFEISIEQLIYTSQKFETIKNETTNSNGKIFAIVGLLLVMILPMISLIATLSGTTVWISSLSDSGLKELHGSSFPMMILLNYTNLALLTIMPGLFLIAISKYIYHYTKSWINTILIVAIILLSFANPIVAVICAFILLAYPVVIKNNTKNNKGQASLHS